MVSIREEDDSVTERITARDIAGVIEQFRPQFEAMPVNAPLKKRLRLCRDIRQSFEDMQKTRGYDGLTKTAVSTRNYLLASEWAKVMPSNMALCVIEYWKVTKQWAPPFDPRFPNPDQTRCCYENYLDYHRCQAKLGAVRKCDYFKRAYTAICPPQWIETFDDRFERGVLPGFHPIEYVE
ncbi:hypothetical protein ACOME3_002799 [Neoechinorhynchus agilis]